MSHRRQKPNPLADAVDTRRRRAERARAEGERTPWENVALIGALAWQIVVPTLIGTALGRWLDGLSGHRVLFSALGIVTGVSLGFWSAWRKARVK